MSNLKPCPFCNSSVEITVYQETSDFECVIICSECGNAVVAEATEQQAIEAWNKRHDEKESIHWHRFHHPKCGDCRHWDTTPVGDRCYRDDIDVVNLGRDHYCAKWEKKE